METSIKYAAYETDSLQEEVWALEEMLEQRTRRSGPVLRLRPVWRLRDKIAELKQELIARGVAC